MSDSLSFTDETIIPASKPTCCPDVYLCLSGSLKLECPRHSGFSVCCSNPETHIQQDRAFWHQQMEHWERSLLDEHIGQHLTSELLAKSPDPGMLAAFTASIPTT